MLIPLYDDDSKLKRHGWLTYLFIIINVVVFLYQRLNPDFTWGYSAIPREIVTNQDLVGEVDMDNNQILRLTPGPNPIYLTIFTAMFMHGGWVHLISNMWFLWIFGDNVELRFGSFRFLVFYVVSGIIASFAHILVDPQSIIPSLGASGAIAGVLGAYLVMFPKNRVNALFIIKIISIPAWIMIGLWGGIQVFNLWSLSSQVGGGVAYGAHVGGFVTGIVLGFAFRAMFDEEPQSVLYPTRPRYS